MYKELFTLADKIKKLREQAGWTQSELAKKLGLTRSSVNGWEMGLSVPSTQYIVELAKLFSVSTDYLFGMNETATISVENLTDKEVALVTDLIKCLSSKHL